MNNVCVFYANEGACFWTTDNKTTICIYSAISVLLCSQSLLTVRKKDNCLIHPFKSSQVMRLPVSLFDKTKKAVVKRFSPVMISLFALCNVLTNGSLVLIINTTPYPITEPLD